MAIPDCPAPITSVSIASTDMFDPERGLRLNRRFIGWEVCSRSAPLITSIFEGETSEKPKRSPGASRAPPFFRRLPSRFANGIRSLFSYPLMQVFIR
jgi:hypothetical protein